MKETAFSTQVLARLGLPGMPTSSEGWRTIAINEGWPYQEYPGRGRGGMRREYTPPPRLLELIQRQQRGEAVTEDEVRAARVRRLYEKASGAHLPQLIAEVSKTRQSKYPVGVGLQHLALRLGIYTHECDWLPHTLTVEQRATLASRAAIALQAVVDQVKDVGSPESNSSVLECALKLAWLVQTQGGHETKP